MTNAQRQTPFLGMRKRTAETESLSAGLSKELNEFGCTGKGLCTWAVMLEERLCFHWNSWGDAAQDNGRYSSPKLAKVEWGE